MPFKKSVSLLLVAAQLSMTTYAWADVTLPQPLPTPGEVDVGAAVSPLKKGQTAPFTGTLLSPKATATIIAQLDNLQEQISIEVNRARGEDKANCDFRTSELATKAEADRKVLSAQLEEREKRLAILNDQLKRQASGSNTTLWVALGTGLGLITGVGLTVLAAFAVKGGN